MKKVIYFGLVFFILLFCIPLPNIKPTYSKTIIDKEGNVVSSNVSSEQQWHLPLDVKIPEQLKMAIILYEDEYFYWHLGINPMSVVKSLAVNVKSRKIKRGASTITMQVMRMRNRSKSRTLSTKLFESVAAVKYSFLRSKNRVLEEWCDIAPFGGNTIGVKTAAFRYFNRNLDQLSPAEIALLAVLPNTPSSVNLAKNRLLLTQRRNNLLKKMVTHQVITHEDYELAVGEDLPSDPITVPSDAQHLLDYLSLKYKDQALFKTTLDRTIQNNLTELINEESTYLQKEDINAMAAMVVDIEKNELVAYVGNSNQVNQDYSYVDVLQSQRSYGSLLKPLLYASALESGNFLPNEFILDIPTNYGEFRPENFDRKYRGIVPLDDIITQSLNVPSVRLLYEYGLNNFYALLQNLKIKHLNRGVDHYGLSIILGGGETSPWEISRIYKGLAQNYMGLSKPYNPIKILYNEIPEHLTSFSFNPYTIEHTIKAMSNLSRPREDKSWQLFGYDHKIAWKTGTSYGHKDAWAAGFNKKYQVTVWVGNEYGEGRKDLTGIVRAAPILFKIFNALPDQRWFDTKPYSSSQTLITVCKETGRLKGDLCQHLKTMKIDKISHSLKTCDFHQINEGDTSLKFHPVVEFYYTLQNPQFKNRTDDKSLKIIYPDQGLKIYLPKTNTNLQNGFLAKTNYKGRSLYWYLNKKYIGKSDGGQMIINAPNGLNQLLVINESGVQDDISFEIIEN